MLITSVFQVDYLKNRPHLHSLHHLHHRGQTMSTNYTITTLPDVALVFRPRIVSIKRSSDEESIGIYFTCIIIYILCKVQPLKEVDVSSLIHHQYLQDLQDHHRLPQAQVKQLPSCIISVG